MGQYTLELRELLEDKRFKLFDFPYDFYDEELKGNFEDKFIQHYFYDEIGCETVIRFKQRLRAKLNVIMPKYKQLYITELESKNINFLLNKDLKETFIRDLEGNIGSTADVNTNTNSINDYKESSIDNGNADAELENLTDVSQSKNNDTSSMKNISNTENKTKESTTLISQGNIGITSSAELLSKWRECILNLDQMIIDECHFLFMGVF